MVERFLSCKRKEPNPKGNGSKCININDLLGCLVRPLDILNFISGFIDVDNHPVSEYKLIGREVRVGVIGGTTASANLR